MVQDDSKDIANNIIMTVFFILLVVFSIRYSPLEEVVFLYATKVQKIFRRKYGKHYKE